MKKCKKCLAVLMLLIAMLAMSSSAFAATAKISKTKATIAVGCSLTLKVTGTSKTVKWSSSNKAVARVSSKGKVTALKTGRTVITAKYGKKKLTCAVTVKKNVWKASVNAATLSDWAACGEVNTDRPDLSIKAMVTKLTYDANKNLVATVAIGNMNTTDSYTVNTIYAEIRNPSGKALATGMWTVDDGMLLKPYKYDTVTLTFDDGMTTLFKNLRSYKNISYDIVTNISLEG